MPDPIRTGLAIPPDLLADEPGASADPVAAEQAEHCATSETQTASTSEHPCLSVGAALKWDPFGRDGSRRPEVKSEWLPEPLARYLRGVAVQIDTNLTQGRMPTSEQLDRFVAKLVTNTKRYIQAAPRKVRHRLQALCALRFHGFWNFTRNEKVKTVTTQELKFAVAGLVENLSKPDFGSSGAEQQQQQQQLLAQPRPLRHFSCGQPVRPPHDDHVHQS